MLSISSLHQISSNHTGPSQRRAPFVNIWISSSTCITVGSPTIQFLGSEVRVWARTKMAKYCGNCKTWRCCFRTYLRPLSPLSRHNFFTGTESHNTWSRDDGIKSPVLGHSKCARSSDKSISHGVQHPKKGEILYILLLDAIDPIGMVCSRFALYFL